MKKMLLLTTFILGLTYLVGCSALFGDKIAIKEGTYTGSVALVHQPRDFDQFSFTDATGVIVIEAISKAEYNTTNGVNSLQDKSRVRRSNYYRVELKIVFNDDKEALVLPLEFIGIQPYTKATTYLHQLGDITIYPNEISIFYDGIIATLKIN